MAKWIQKALDKNHRGILRKELGLNKKGTIPVKALKQAADKGTGVIARRANMALTLRNIRKSNKK